MPFFQWNEIVEIFLLAPKGEKFLADVSFQNSLFLFSLKLQLNQWKKLSFGGTKGEREREK